MLYHQLNGDGNVLQFRRRQLTGDEALPAGASAVHGGDIERPNIQLVIRGAVSFRCRALGCRSCKAVPQFVPPQLLCRGRRCGGGELGWRCSLARPNRGLRGGRAARARARRGAEANTRFCSGPQAGLGRWIRTDGNGRLRCRNSTRVRGDRRRWTCRRMIAGNSGGSGTRNA